MVVWNVLMVISVLGAIVAAGSAIWGKVTPIFDPGASMQIRIVGGVVLTVAIVYILLVMVGFALKPKTESAAEQLS